MPESHQFNCDVCGKSVDDGDLKANATLRRIVINAQAFKSPDASTIQEGALNLPLVFCGQAHAAQWATNWIW